MFDYLSHFEGALEALRAGVARVQILDGTQPHTLRDSFAAGGSGTIIRGAARPLAPTTSVVL